MPLWIFFKYFLKFLIRVALLSSLNSFTQSERKGLKSWLKGCEVTLCFLEVSSSSCCSHCVLTEIGNAGTDLAKGFGLWELPNLSPLHSFLPVWLALKKEMEKLNWRNGIEEVERNAILGGHRKQPTKQKSFPKYQPRLWIVVPFFYLQSV